MEPHQRWDAECGGSEELKYGRLAESRLHWEDPTTLTKAPMRPRSRPKKGIASATMKARIPQTVVEPLNEEKNDGNQSLSHIAQVSALIKHSQPCTPVDDTVGLQMLAVSQDANKEELGRQVEVENRGDPKTRKSDTVGDLLDSGTSRSESR